MEEAEARDMQEMRDAFDQTQADRANAGSSFRAAPVLSRGVAPPSTHPTPPHMIYCWKDLLPGIILAGVSGPQVGLG